MRHRSDLERKAMFANMGKGKSNLSRVGFVVGHRYGPGVLKPGVKNPWVVERQYPMSRAKAEKEEKKLKRIIPKADVELMEVNFATTHSKGKSRSRGTPQQRRLNSDLQAKGLLKSGEKITRISGNTSGTGISKLKLHIGSETSDNMIQADYFGKKTIPSRAVEATVDKSTGRIIEVHGVETE